MYETKNRDKRGGTSRLLTKSRQGSQWKDVNLIFLGMYPGDLQSDVFYECTEERGNIRERVQ